MLDETEDDVRLVHDDASVGQCHRRLDVFEEQTRTELCVVLDDFAVEKRRLSCGSGHVSRPFMETLGESIIGCRRWNLRVELYC